MYLPTLHNTYLFVDNYKMRTLDCYFSKEHKFNLGKSSCFLSLKICTHIIMKTMMMY